MSELEFIDAHDERILIHCRTDMKQEIIPIFWTGAGAEFITDSSTVSLIFETDFEIREQWIRVTMDDVTEAVCNFLKVLRKCNPGAKLIWIYGMFGTELEEAIEKGVDKFNSEEAIICGAINMKQKADYIRIPFANASDYGSKNSPSLRCAFCPGWLLEP